MNRKRRKETNTGAAVNNKRSGVYFALMAIGLWLGIGLPPIGHGVLNLCLLAVGVYSGYRYGKGWVF
jgi:hypothetical protein